MEFSKIVNALMWGSFFIVLGVLWLLDSLGVIKFSLSQWWPVVFIIIGVSIIVEGFTKKK